MTETLDDAYPEAAPYIRDAVDEHGEEWVLDHYYTHLYTLGRVIEMPEKEALPFYDDEKHDTMTEAERTEMYRMWAEYRENLRTGTKPSGGDSDRER